MSEYVNEAEARKAHNEGVKIGETEPSRETKGAWWEVFKTPNGIVACVMTSYGVSCGEKITEDELRLYVDDVDAAKAVLMANLEGNAPASTGD